MLGERRSRAGWCADLSEAFKNPDVEETEAATEREQKEEKGRLPENRPCTGKEPGRMKSSDLFFASGESRDFSSVLREVQGYLSKEYSGLVTAGGSDEVKAQIRRFAGKYIQDHRICVAGMGTEELIDAIYSEMAEFGFLTKYVYGEGKSYLLKLILTNLREAGMRICALDPEMEYEELTKNLGGCFIDLMGGEFLINPLEPKIWDDSSGLEDADAPQTFRIRSRLSQHISFLKDFFRSYKDFTDRELDVIEIMVQKLYAKWGISDRSHFDRMNSYDYPVLSDLYDFMEEEYKGFDENGKQIYTAEMLQGILLGLHSMCMGAESKFFNGHTNITDSGFITFGVKGLLQASRSLKDALLFNVLSFMSNELLTQGNAAASLDEFYLFLSNLTAVEYVRNFSKRVRKKDSAVIIASQNLEDFNLDGIREYTKPLFSIPTHQFLFNAGSIDAKFYTDTLQLEECEYQLIRYPQRGVCLYKCGNERYNLMVHAPEHKAKLFGDAGGR